MVINQLGLEIPRWCVAMVYVLKLILLQKIPIKMVAAGAEHTAAVTESGELYGWGWGRYGNLGLGDRRDRLVPEKVSLSHVCI